MFAPTDEDVERELGECVRSWAPLSYIEYKRNFPGVGSIYPVLVVALFVVCSVASSELSRRVFHQPAPLLQNPVRWVTTIGVMAIAYGALVKINNTRHNRRRLGVFRRGIRFGKSRLRFDEIAEMSCGNYQTLWEKHFSLLEKFWELLLPAYPLVKNDIRANTLDFKRHDGTTVHWVGVMGMFNPEEIAEFLELLKPHVAGSSVTSGENAAKLASFDQLLSGLVVSIYSKIVSNS